MRFTFATLVSRSITSNDQNQRLGENGSIRSRIFHPSKLLSLSYQFHYLDNRHILQNERVEIIPGELITSTKSSILNRPSRCRCDCRPEICPGLHLIRCTRISISVMKCPLALLANFNITCVSEYRQFMSQSVPQMLLFK